MAYLPYPHGLYHRFLGRRAAAAAAGLVAAQERRGQTSDAAVAVMKSQTSLSKRTAGPS
jgi:hypothetical protein